MPGGEGNKYQNFLTAKEKWLIGIFLATGMTASVTFVVNMVLIAQLKPSIDKATAGNTQGSTAARTSNGWERQFEEWKNLTVQNQNETKNLLQDLQNRVRKLENTSNQNENKELQDIRKKMINLESKLEGGIKKSDERYYEILAMEGWKKLSNGLRYRLLEHSSYISFAKASESCKTRGARLASTGIRNATIRSEMWIRLPNLAGKTTWIGLTKTYGATWVWYDGGLYKNTDISWAWGNQNCANPGYGFIHWVTFTGTFYCSGPNNNIKNCLCEI